MTNYICTEMCFHHNRLYKVGEKLRTAAEDNSPYFKSTDPEPVDPPEEVSSKLRTAKAPIAPPEIEPVKKTPKKTSK